VVCILKIRVDILYLNAFHVVRSYKSVYDDSKVAFLIGYVTVAAGRQKLAVLVAYAS
jgi:hypothetical protein